MIPKLDFFLRIPIEKQSFAEIFESSSSVSFACRMNELFSQRLNVFFSKLNIHFFHPAFIWQMN